MERWSNNSNRTFVPRIVTGFSAKHAFVPTQPSTFKHPMLMNVDKTQEINRCLEKLAHSYPCHSRVLQLGGRVEIEH